MFIFMASLFVPMSYASIVSQDTNHTVEGMLDSFLPPYTPNISIVSVSKWTCPEKLNASWLLRPPFTKLTNSSGSDDKKSGIFYTALEFAFNRCCGKLKGGKKTFISCKTHAAANTSMLHRDIRMDETDLIFPVQSDTENEYKGYLSYLKILDSPGVVLIQRSDSIQRSSANNLWSAIGNCWPIIVMTVVLSLAAGLCVWAMETRKNAQEFGNPLCRGAFDGFWWAFVTMSTVGYGDKTPKSITGRLFSILWIIIGITICSILTATLSSALTSVTVEKYDVIAGKKIGVVRDSIALKKAVNLGVHATVFEDLDEVYEALVNDPAVHLDGMMEEMFIAMEYMNQKNNSLLSVTHLFEERHGYGIAFNINVKMNRLWDEIGSCMSKVIPLIAYDIYVTINEQINEVKKSKVQASTRNRYHVHKTVIDKKSPVFIGTMIGSCGSAVVFCTIYMALKCYRGGCFDKQGYDVEKGQEQGSSRNAQKKTVKEPKKSVE